MFFLGDTEGRASPERITTREPRDGFREMQIYPMQIMEKRGKGDEKTSDNVCFLFRDVM